MHPTLTLRAAVRMPSGRVAIPPQDVTPAAAGWVGGGAPARVDPMDVLPLLDRGARDAAVRGILELESPAEAFPAFARRVEAEGGEQELLAHLSDLASAELLSRRARAVLRDASRAAHRPALRGEPLFDPLAECYYDGVADLGRDWTDERDTEGPMPFAFGTRLARWPGLTAAEVGEWTRSEGTADVAAILEASLDGFHPGALDALTDVAALEGAVGEWERHGCRGAGLSDFLDRWNARQRVLSRVADRALALWTAPGASRPSVLAWCREVDERFAEAVRGVAATWPRRPA